jgi:hypothetical protein
VFQKITAEQWLLHRCDQKYPLKPAATKTDLGHQLPKALDTLAACHLKPRQLIHFCRAAATPRYTRKHGSSVDQELMSCQGVYYVEQVARDNSV